MSSRIGFFDLWSPPAVKLLLPYSFFRTWATSAGERLFEAWELEGNQSQKLPRGFGSRERGGGVGRGFQRVPTPDVGTYPFQLPCSPEVGQGLLIQTTRAPIPRVDVLASELAPRSSPDLPGVEPRPGRDESSLNSDFRARTESFCDGTDFRRNDPLLGGITFPPAISFPQLMPWNRAFNKRARPF